MIKDCVIITGPTAVGKSEIAVDVAKNLGGEIISADSMQIYKGLNIGSGKIKEEDMQGIPHHLLDIKNINDSYCVANFCEDAKSLLLDISSRDKVPIIVGGTGLYIKALVSNYDYGGVQCNEAIRNELEKIAEEKGLEFLYEELKKNAPERAEKISPNDKKRIIRALEIFLQNSSEIKSKIQVDYNYKIFVLNMDRKCLYERINRRVEMMFENGLLEEFESLLSKGYKRESLSGKGIGYAELFDYKEGKISYAEAVDKIKQHSRNYAKRQLTFFRSMQDTIYIDASIKNKAVLDILNEVKNG